ncbi:MAG: hypothetical protein QGG73_02425 [Candidatus Hydrogenedentes bacterium]|jgi:hypothetical protein|nr:hypothetical protein [Candidatus Hydrogenedentota bacterium]
MRRIQTALLSLLALAAGATLEGCAVFRTAGKVIETAVVTTGEVIKSILP